MRISARLDDRSAQKLSYIIRTTQASITDAITEAIDHYYQEVQQKYPPPEEVLTRSGFIGCVDGAPDLSERYKERWREGLEAKHDHR